jgi:hypothetical protein
MVQILQIMREYLPAGRQAANYLTNYPPRLRQRRSHPPLKGDVR